MDVIGNMFTIIRNAVLVKKKEVKIPHSKIKENIAKVLKEKKFISNYNVNNLENNKRELVIELKYFSYGNCKTSVISGINRISKPSLRVMTNYKDIPRVFGCLILSTNKGIMSSDDAKKMKIGGEILGHVW